MRKEMFMPATDRKISMSISKRFAITLLAALFAGVMAQAQNLTVPSRGGQTPAPAVEDVQIIIQSQQVRIAARSTVIEMQLQIFDQAGSLIYDSGLLTGSELSWALQNASGESVPSGLYAYTLSVKEANAETSALQRGHMIVERGRDRDPQTDRLWVTSQGPVGAETAVSGGEMTVSTGPETNVVGAQIGRSLASKGASALNLQGFGTTGQIPQFGGGNYLIDSVISQDSSGRIGIGTTSPSSPLTVAGQIETKAGGIKFPDGTLQTTSATGSLFQVSHDTTLSGNGTADSLLGVNIPALNQLGGASATLTDTDVTSVFAVDVAGTTINNLPAGDYIYSASLYITPIGGPAVTSCLVLGTGASSSSGLGETTVTTPQWIPIIGRLSLLSPGGAVIRCSKGITGVNNFKAHGGLTVTHVQALR
jgi:hypothetical protein